MEFVFVVGDFVIWKIKKWINTFKMALEKQDFVVEFCEGTTAQEKQKTQSNTQPASNVKWKALQKPANYVLTVPKENFLK